MGQKVEINGTGYDLKGGKPLIGGTAYAIKKGRTLIGGTGYDISFVSYDPVFSNNEWSAIIDACQSRNVPDTWTVGSQKSMSIGGTSYLVDIIGLNHDDYADGSGKAPLTLQMHDCYSQLLKMNNGDNTNYGGWTNCAMRSTHLNTIFALMPSEVQSGVRAVNKLTSAGIQSYNINTTADKLFLVSEVEVFGDNDYSAPGEGTQYDYYMIGNSKLKRYGSSNVVWWTRSPNVRDNQTFCTVTNGGAKYYGYSSSALGTAIAFCF